MNILESALNNVNGLISNQKIELFKIEIENVNGLASEVLKEKLELYAHIQPITSVEMKKITESTLDSNQCYKIFFINEKAKILSSFNQKIETTYIKWQDKILKAYALRDWYLQNGWLALYVTITNDNLDFLKELE